jgi:hypothetical protein
MRYFVQSYALLSIPCGYLVNEIVNQKLFIRLFFGAFFIALGFLNLFQIWQYTVGIITEYSMTYSYYKRIFLKTKVSDADRKLMEVTRSVEATETFENEKEYEPFAVGYYNFSDANATPIDFSRTDSSRFVSPPTSYLYNSNQEFGPKFQLQYDHAVPTNKDHAWLRISLKYFSEEDIKDFESDIVINMPHNDYNLKYRAYNFAKFPWKKGEWNSVQFDYMTPFPYNEKDKFDIYIWHRGKNDLWVDDFKIEAFTKKD